MPAYSLYDDKKERNASLLFIIIICMKMNSITVYNELIRLLFVIVCALKKNIIEYKKIHDI